MRPVRLLFAAALTAAASPALPLWPPPRRRPTTTTCPRLPVDQVEFTATVDTTEATTQPDLFNPNRDGQPLGGGAAEPTACKGTAFGKTVWYDLAPQVRRRPAAAGDRLPDGRRGLRVEPAGLADHAAGRLQRQRRRRRPAAESRGQEELHDPGRRSGRRRRRAHASTRRSSRTRRRRILDDPLDKCPTVPGIERFGGCPPELRVVPQHRLRRHASGITITRLFVDRVPKGAKVVATCSAAAGRRRSRPSGRPRHADKFVGRACAPASRSDQGHDGGKTGTGTLSLRRDRELLRVAGAGPAASAPRPTAA